MVSIGSGFNNPYFAQQRTQLAKGAEETQQTNGAARANAPSIPNIPPKKKETVQEHYEGPISSYVRFTSRFTQEQCIELFNEGIEWMLTNGVLNTLIPTQGHYPVINISNYDITNFTIKQEADGSFTIEYTAQITCDYSYTVESDWGAGDLYTDENGYTRQYQEDGSWKDVSNEVHNDGGTNSGGNALSDGSLGGIKPGIRDSVIGEKEQKMYDMSTLDFLKMRDVGKEIKLS